MYANCKTNRPGICCELNQDEASFANLCTFLQDFQDQSHTSSPYKVIEIQTQFKRSHLLHDQLLNLTKSLNLSIVFLQPKNYHCFVCLLDLKP